MGRYLRTVANKCALLTSRANYAGVLRVSSLLPISAAAVFSRCMTNLPRPATSTPLSPHWQIVRHSSVRWSNCCVIWPFYSLSIAIVWIVSAAFSSLSNPSPSGKLSDSDLEWCLSIFIAIGLSLHFINIR